MILQVGAHTLAEHSSVLDREKLLQFIEDAGYHSKLASSMAIGEVPETAGGRRAIFSPKKNDSELAPKLIHGETILSGNCSKLGTLFFIHKSMVLVDEVTNFPGEHPIFFIQKGPTCHVARVYIHDSVCYQYTYPTSSLKVDTRNFSFPGVTHSLSTFTGSLRVLPIMSVKWLPFAIAEDYTSFPMDGDTTSGVVLESNLEIISRHAVLNPIPLIPYL